MSDSKLKMVTDKAHEMDKLEDQIYDLERQLKSIKEAHKHISEDELPMMMSEIGLKDFTLDNGSKVAIKPELKVSIPKHKMDEANKWLVKHGHDGMVRTLLTLQRGVPDYAINQIIQFIIAQGFLAQSERVIHPQTLNKWGREMELEGDVIPEDIFSVFRRNVTVIE